MTDGIPAAELARQLADARVRSLLLISGLDDEQWLGAKLEIVNPILWEIGHVVWFQERWTLRHLGRRESLRADADELYDSFAIAHDTRWDLLLPSREETLRYAQGVLNAVLERLSEVELTAEERYFHRLVLYHEDMHGEAFVHTRQTLGFPAPRAPGESAPGGGPLAGDVEVEGATFPLGATPDRPFVFDNEKWAHEVEVRPFRIARAPVTQGEFAAFVEDDGYGRRELWSDEGWRWREAEGARAPVYWRRDGNRGWERRAYDRWVPLEEHRAMLHASWHEAEAYCRWTDRRLPTEAEWELAAGSGARTYPWGEEEPSPDRAQLDLSACDCAEVGALPAGESPAGCRQMLGNVWEWTASTFNAYPGFVIDPYKEYSEPWFGTRKVLRGGCFATRARMLRNTWRNFYTPDRRDVLAGFRTAADPD